MFDGLPDSTLFGLVSYNYLLLSETNPTKNLKHFLSYPFLGYQLHNPFDSDFYFPQSGGQVFEKTYLIHSHFLVIPKKHLLCIFLYSGTTFTTSYTKKKETCVFCVSVDCFSGRSKSQRCDNMKRSSI